MKQMLNSMLLFWLACALIGCGSDSTSGLASSAAGNIAVNEQGGSSGTDPQAPELFFSVSRSSIQAGDTVVLTWNASKADTCFASGQWTGDRAKVGEETVTLIGTGVYNFRLVCTAGQQSVEKVLTVVVTEKMSLPTIQLDPSVQEAESLFKWLVQAESA